MTIAFESPEIQLQKLRERVAGELLFRHPSAGRVTLSHSVAWLARLELVVANFKGVCVG
jgi:hypothetical protein